MNTHPTDQEIARALTPWFSTFASVFQSAEEKQLEAIGVLGIPRRGERAGDFHRALRTLFRVWCDETNGIFRMAEEAEGLGLDYMVCSLIPEKPFAIRFGRFNGLIVKRNSTYRQADARAFGVLSSEFLFAGIDEPEVGQLSQVTLAYSVEDDRTLGGVPAWYMEKVLLLKEQFDGVELLAELARFSAPENIVDDVRRVVAVPRSEELELWREQIGDARKHG